MNDERAKPPINRGDHEFVTPDGQRWDATNRQWSNYPYSIDLIEANKARHTLGLPLGRDNHEPSSTLKLNTAERLARKDADCA